MKNTALGETKDFSFFFFHSQNALWWIMPQGWCMQTSTVLMEKEYNWIPYNDEPKKEKKKDPDRQSSEAADQPSLASSPQHLQLICSDFYLSI